MIETETKTVLCNMCGEVIAVAKDSLSDHKEEHTDRKPHLCSMCGEAFTDLDDLLTHEEEHRREQLFACVECRKEFTSEGNLDKHLKTHDIVCAVDANSSKDREIKDFLNPENEEKNMKYGTRTKNDRNDGGGNVAIGEDEIVVKKSEWEQLQKEVEDSRKKSQALNAGGSSVVVSEKTVQVLKEGIKKMKRGLELLDGRELDEGDDEDVEKAPKRKIRHDQPPSPSTARLFRKQRVETEKVQAKNLPNYKPGDTKCTLCKEDYDNYASLVNHFSKFHKNEYIYYCEKCGKGFMTSSGHNLHVAAHDVSTKLTREKSSCSKTFGSKLALKKHKVEQHGPKKKWDEHKCEFCGNVFKTKYNMWEHVQACGLNPKRQPIYCEICEEGPYYLAKRVMQHKRKCHGWT